MDYPSGEIALGVMASWLGEGPRGLEGVDLCRPRHGGWIQAAGRFLTVWQAA